MPIIDLQRRMRQLGEIRIGRVVDTGRVSERTGKAILRPEKLKAFRFTSPSKEILEQVATLYGGEVQPWTPANGGPDEFEVYSDATRLPVLIPPRDSVSQWYEHYQGSKCVRRCDGQVEQKSDRPCMCNPDRRMCKITTRVNVMLRDVAALGQWLLISKGYYAAVELPPAAELLAQVGGYVQGWLGMEEKLVVREDGPTRFMVPTLDVEITPTQLMAGQVTGAPAVAAGPERVAITGGRPDYAALAAVATSADEVGKLWKQAVQAGHMDDALKAALTARGEVLRSAEQTTTAAGQTGGEDEPSRNLPAPADEVHDVEIVDDGDLEDLWFQIIAAAGTRGWTTDEVEQKFAARHGGLMPATASAEQLSGFLAAVKRGEVA
ncbi:recombination directionality factor [Actinacidiphila rubida]|uniref:Uncharacterized protein n=1 Tax=Actinacidiphila rubida TaxID=310780 RepID=A0A1H8SWQ2_9ACTN|nr:hypothetical protein [Actinacidiphila rubida]SEO82906.1 hypothetical protein SAMN05216267_104614 [Actinacidiphila rubida]